MLDAPFLLEVQGWTWMPGSEPSQEAMERTGQAGFRSYLKLTSSSCPLGLQWCWKNTCQPHSWHIFFKGNRAIWSLFAPVCHPLPSWSPFHVDLLLVIRKRILLLPCCERRAMRLVTGKIQCVPGPLWGISSPSPTWSLVSPSNNKEMQDQIPSKTPQSPNHNPYIQRTKIRQHLPPTPYSSNIETWKARTHLLFTILLWREILVFYHTHSAGILFTCFSFSNSLSSPKIATSTMHVFLNKLLSP